MKKSTAGQPPHAVKQQNPPPVAANAQNPFAFSNYSQYGYGPGYYGYSQPVVPPVPQQSMTPAYYAVGSYAYPGPAPVAASTSGSSHGLASPLGKSRQKPVKFTIPATNGQQKLAYTAVGVSTRPAETSAKRKSVDSSAWPESLRDLVTKVFTKAGSKRDEVAKKMKDYISLVNSRGELWTVDWKNVVVPGLEQYTSNASSAPGVDLLTSMSDSSLLVSEQPSSRKRHLSEVDESPKSPSMTKIGLATASDRAKRFASSHAQSAASSPSMSARITPLATADESEAFIDKPIVGTSQKLEKRYLRLTSAPDPQTVRPEHILREAVKLLIVKWKQDRDYGYICDQLKAVRQDLTVQMIRNEFTVQVYELHARIALEKADLGEYNQCQTQLQQLYSAGVPGNEVEFTAYRLLYFIHTKNRTAVSQFMRSLPERFRIEPAIKHALQVRTAVASANFHSLSHLYLNSVNMGAYLIDNFIERERVNALKLILKSYRPTIELPHVAKQLGFVDTDFRVDLDKCREFMHGLFSEDQNPAILYADKEHSQLDCKNAAPIFVDAARKFEKVDIKGQLM